MLLRIRFRLENWRKLKLFDGSFASKSWREYQCKLKGTRIEAILTSLFIYLDRRVHFLIMLARPHLRFRAGRTALVVSCESA
jgi:hypothetical protein